MSKKINLKILMIVGLFSLGSWLRINQYWQFPVVGETRDEFAWTFLGSSLLQTGEPTSWSYFSAYGERQKIQMGEHYFELVTPALDHPPLFAFLPGTAHAFQHHWNELPSIKVIRAPMILLAILNLLLFMKVAQLYLKSEFEQFTAMAIFATAPIIVFSSRLVVAENLILTFMLLTLIVLKMVKKSKQQTILLTTLSVLAVLTKVEGIVLPASLVLFGLLKKEKRFAQSGILAAVIGFALFALYGAWFGWSTFLSIFQSQSSRDIGLATFFTRFFSHPAVVDKFFLDGWIATGIIATIVRLVEKKSVELVDCVAIVTIGFIVFTVGEQTTHGWYTIPLFPLFAIYVAELVEYLIKEKKTLALWLLWLLLLPALRLAFIFIGEKELLTHLVRILALLGFIPVGLQIMKQEKLIKPTVVILGLLIVLAHTVSVLKVTDSKYWEDDEYFVPSRIVK